MLLLAYARRVAEYMMASGRVPTWHDRTQRLQPWLPQARIAARREPAPQHDDWLAALYSAPSQSQPTAAPNDFTARVMARLATPAEDEQSAPTTTASACMRYPSYAAASAYVLRINTPAEPSVTFATQVRIVLGTLGFSALVALVSSCVVTILAPGTVLALLGLLLGMLLAAVDALRTLLAFTLNAATQDGLLLAVSAVLGGVLLVRSRLPHAFDIARRA